MKKLVLITATLIFTAMSANAAGGSCPFSGDRNTKTAAAQVSNILKGNSSPQGSTK